MITFENMTLEQKLRMAGRAYDEWITDHLRRQEALMRRDLGPLDDEQELDLADVLALQREQVAAGRVAMLAQLRRQWAVSSTVH